MKRALAAVIVAAAPMVATAGLAQTAPGSAASPNSTIPEKVKPVPDTSLQNGRSSTLSDKLDSTNGVIRPNTSVDPGMTKAPPPSGSSTPVIKPQGTPGGPPGPEAK